MENGRGFGLPHSVIGHPLQSDKVVTGMGMPALAPLISEISLHNHGVDCRLLGQLLAILLFL